MAVTVDILAGSSARRYYSRNGAVVMGFTRVALVSGVQDSMDSDEDEFVAAVNALIAVVGDVGTGEHPTYPGAWIQDFQEEPESTDAIRIRIVYKERDDSIQIQGGTSLSQVETNTDINGLPIGLSYQYPADYELDTTKRGRTVKQGGMVSVLRPDTTRVYTRIEVVDPLLVAATYTGKVNSATFLGGAPGHWLCMDINYSSNDGGITWEVKYTFQYKLEGWDPTVMFINPDDGRPPEDLEDYEGSRDSDDFPGMYTPPEYTSIDFGALGLT